MHPSTWRENTHSLKQKHPQSRQVYEEALMNGEPPVVHHIIFDDINEVLVWKAAIRTKGRSNHLD